MKKFLIVIIGAFLWCGCNNHPDISLPYFNTADFTPTWPNTNGLEFKNLHTIPSFSFTDQNGKNVSNKNTAGKIYVANFFFTRCTNICPKMTDNMKKVSDAFLGDNKVLFISHSVTPLYDNVSVLKQYADKKNITNPNYHLVTGSQEKIYTIARRGYFADTTTGSAITQQFLHTENLILVDKYSHIRGVYNGTIDLEVDNLVKHIKLLEQEN